MFFQIFKNGFRIGISGGIIVQSDKFKEDKFHIGFANSKEVTWLNFGES